MLQHVREYDDIESPRRWCQEDVADLVADRGVGKTRARRCDVVFADVDSDHRCARTRRDIMRQGPGAATDIQNPLASTDSLDKEVVVADVPMFGVHAVSILDRFSALADVKRFLD